MNVLLKDKKIIILLIAFIVLFPIGIFGLRIQSPVQPEEPTIPAGEQKVAIPSQSISLPESDPKKRLLDYIQNRRPLSESDMKAKSTILEAVEKSGSGILFQNNNVVIEYVNSADLFQVEILTLETAVAKEEALAWFKEKGMSTKGICNLPVTFYLNFDIKTQLGEDANLFNPLPDSC